jgi:hypothetical protein
LPTQSSFQCLFSGKYGFAMYFVDFVPLLLCESTKTKLPPIPKPSTDILFKCITPVYTSIELGLGCCTIQVQGSGKVGFVVEIR